MGEEGEPRGKQALAPCFAVQGAASLQNGFPDLAEDLPSCWRQQGDQGRLSVTKAEPSRKTDLPEA